MYLPKKFWPTRAHKKLQTLGATALIGASLIGCSTATPSTTEVVDTAVSVPTTLSTSIPLAADITKTLPSATLTPLPTDMSTSLPTETAVSVLPTSLPPTTTPVSAGQYVDGDYLGDAVRTHRWGYTQVIAHVESGMLVDVEIAQYPNSKNRSAQISWAAFPTLITEAVQNQDADINIVTRATDTSVAFIQSLDSALDDAAVGASS
ncbi:MAG: hypothetical protein KDE48_16915 [Anaerolineales bacterium]|nr:hypothetical protein [Anaerolineales bacterium]